MIMEILNTSCVALRDFSGLLGSEEVQGSARFYFLILSHISIGNAYYFLDEPVHPIFT